MIRIRLSVATLVFLVLAVAIDVGVSQVNESRTWTDISGKYSTEAKLAWVENGKVHLVNVDGQPIEMDLQRLSLKDQKYVEDYAKTLAGATNSAATADPAEPGLGSSENDGEMITEAGGTPTQLEEYDTNGEVGSSGNSRDRVDAELPVVEFILIGIVLVLAVVGSVWLIVAAFSESIAWGLGVLLVPVVPLIFICCHWDRAKPAAICLFCGTGLAIGAAVVFPVMNAMTAKMGQ